MRLPANLSSALVALLGVTLVYACGGGEKKKGGGGNNNTAAPAPAPLPLPSPSPSPSNPCLTGSAQNFGATEDSFDLTLDDPDSPSPGPAPAPGPAGAPAPGPTTPPTEDGGGGTSDCGPGTNPSGPSPGAGPGTEPGTGPSPSPSPGTGGGGMSDIGKGVDGCAAEGKVWTPGKPAASCGPQIWDAICCNAEAWLAAFAQHSRVADAKAAIDKNVADGKKLYGCSVDGAKWTLHFAKLFDTVGYSYSTYYLTFSGGKQPVTGEKPASCPALPTMAELGYKAPATGPAPGPAPSPAMNDPGATFTAASTKADILAWLKTGAYTTSTGASAWVANDLHAAGSAISEGSAHGAGGKQVRVFYNKKIATAMELATQPPTWPKDSVIVKELRAAAPANTLEGYAFMAKIKEGTGLDSWLWYEIVNKDQPGGAGEFHGVGGTTGVNICTGCHDNAGNKDYVRELLDD